MISGFFSCGTPVTIVLNDKEVRQCFVLIIISTFNIIYGLSEKELPNYSTNFIFAVKIFFALIFTAHNSKTKHIVTYPHTEHLNRFKLT